MSRSERYTTESEIRRNFPESTDHSRGAGPVLKVKNGKRYIDDSSAHMAVVGATGKGKSQCASLPFVREIFAKGESGIFLDPKKELLTKTACWIPKYYQVFVVDFRDPRKSQTAWNPLKMPMVLFNSKDPTDNDIASSQVSEFWNGVYPWDGHSDKFWTEASVNYAKGLTYALFERAESEYINMDSVAVMMEQSEISQGTSTVIKSFYDTLPNDSLAKRNLATYVTAPNETRASIHSVAASGIEVFSRSRGLMEMMSHDSLDILNLDVTRPFVLYIVTPDETDVYSGLAAMLVSQMTQHLIRKAQELGGALPIRVNIILEELGSIGKSIPTLPNILVAGRSRNIRMMLILQSSSQLIDVYGKSKAETINSCIGITIGFSTNNWETLGEWSQRCGERQTMVNGHLIKEPLITASQLAAMPTGTALIMVDNRFKFISSLPLYNEMYDNSAWKEPNIPIKRDKCKAKTMNFEELVKSERSRKLEGILSDRKKPNSSDFPRFPFFSESGEVVSHDVDDLVARIDEKIAQLEAEEEAEKKKESKHKKTSKYVVTILATDTDKEAVAEIVARCKGIALAEAKKEVATFPAEVSVGKKEDADNLMQELSKQGIIAMICD